MKILSNDLKSWKYARLFLDSSALLKLLVPEFQEPGTYNLISYHEKPNPLYTCDYCIGEVLGVLKRKWIYKKETQKLTTDDYLLAIDRLNLKIKCKTLISQQGMLLSKYDFNSAQLVRKYDIDYIDAFLLNYVKESNEYDLFVTADGDLSKAAKEYKVKYWNILECDTPPKY